MTIGVAFTGPQLVELLGNPALVRSLNTSGLSFAVAGIDRIDGTAPTGPTIESTIAAAFLAERTPDVAWLAASAVHRDHPYNLARRIASADHLAAGRIGLALGVRDGYAPGGGTVWGGAGLTPGLPIGIATTHDAAELLQELWQSYPADAIVADRATGTYARGDRIRRVEHYDDFRVEGTLTVPTTPQGAPVLAWRVSTTTSATEAALAAEVADVLISPAPTDHPTIVETGDADRIDDLLAADGVVGVLLRDADLTRTWPAHGGGTLRERLGLPAATPRLASAPSAFPS